MKIKLTLFISALFCLSIANANLQPPISFPDTALLPKGVSTVSFKQLAVQPRASLSSSGQSQALGKPFAKPLGWINVTEGDVQAAQTLQAATQSAGPGMTSASVKMNVSASAPIFGYAVNNNISVGFGIPYYVYDVNVRTGFDFNKNTEAFCQDPSQAGLCQKMKTELPHALKVQSQALGYKAIAPRRVSGIGDVILQARILTYQDEKNKVIIAPSANLPTGQGPVADDVIGVSTGDGQLDLGASIYWDYTIVPRLWINTYAGYNHQFADHVEQRIPYEAGNPLSPDKDRVLRKLGNSYSTGASFNYGSATSGSVGVGYSYQFLEESNFQGSKFNAVRYKYLNDLQLSQNMHTLMLKASYSTIDGFQAKKYAVPMTFGVYYAKPFDGKNVVIGDLLSADISVYF